MRSTTMKRPRVLIVCGISLVITLSAGCGEQKSTTGPTSSRALGTSLAAAGRISVAYKYSGEVSRHDIASDAEFRAGAKLDPFARARADGLCDEDGERRLKVTFELPGEGGRSCPVVARFRFTGQGAQIRKATLDQRWETQYIFDNEDADLRLGIPRVETYDLTTRKKVSETKNIRLVSLVGGKPKGMVSSEVAKDFGRRVVSQTWDQRRWGFSGDEFCYYDGKVVFASSFVRDVATGLLVSEQVKKGELPRDYHHYELVVISWPDGAIPGTKIDLVPGGG